MMLSRERKEGKLEGIKEGMQKGKLEGIKEGIAKGMQKGKLEGIKERNYIIAKNMKKENIDIEIIKRITGLSIEEIEKL